MASIVSAGTTSATALNMSADTSGVLQLASNNGTVALTIDTSQNVGIGTSSPNNNLEIFAGDNGGINIEQSGSLQTGYLNFRDSDGTLSGRFSYDHGNDSMRFSTAATERVRINASGEMGIGTSSPTTRLDVVVSGTGEQNILGLRTTGGGGQGMLLGVNTTNLVTTIKNNTGGTYGMAFYSGSGTAESMRVDASGNLLVGTTSNIGSTSILTAVQPSVTNLAVIGAQASSASYAYNILDLNTATASGTGFTFIKCRVSNYTTTVFQVLGNGNAQNANNSYGATSDIKLKENIVDASPKLADLLQVKIRNYNLKSDPTHKQIGVIAQELEDIFPSMIDEVSDKDLEGNDLGTTTKAVKYSVFIPMLIKAIQELNAKVTALENK
jgi:hypothetical protein